jgi:cell division protease FtsH
MPPVSRKIIVPLAALFAAFALWLAYAAWQDDARRTGEQPLAYSELLDAIVANRIAATTITGRTVLATAADGGRSRTVVPESDRGDLVRELRGHGAAIAFDDGPEGLVAHTMKVAEASAPLILVLSMLGVLALGGGSFFGMGRATRIKPQDTGVCFADVAGVDEAKEELRETVEFLRDPRRFAMAGARVPKGILLVGPPGNGKTMLAKAAASEAGVPFFSASGSDFVEMFVGVGASRVRGLFREARAKAPCLVFIDEIDALAGRRGEVNSHAEREQTLNQLLVELDGMVSGGAVVIIGATNRVDVLDPAVTRPGRFDRHIHVGHPDVAGRRAILAAAARPLTLTDDACMHTVARGTAGFSGAEIANLVNEAALAAARRGQTTVAMEDFERARDRLLMGNERRSLAITGTERRLIAVHEAGHALVSIHCPEADPIHKATVIPRGGALGMVVRLPEGDRVSLPRAKVMADIAVAMAGRAAEELVFGADAVTTGAEADFRAATDLARRMVTVWGMSEAVGFVSHAPHTAGSGPQGSPQATSERTAWLIDREIRRIAGEGMEAARRILERERDSLLRIADALQERETLSGEDIAALAGESCRTRHSGLAVAVPLG